MLSWKWTSASVIASLLVALVASLVWGSEAWAASRGKWQLVRAKVAYGDVAVTSTSKTLTRPHGAAVYVQKSGSVVWSCQKGYSYGAWSRDYRAGFHVLPYVRGKSSCTINVAASGEGRAIIRIYRARW